MIQIFDSITIDLKQLILPIVYIALGIFIYGIIIKIVERIMENSKKNLKNHQYQRVKTLKMLIMNIIKYAIGIIVLLAILANFGVNVSSLVAGLGITTAIIGLAFQDLAKDLIAGFSIITEGQYEVGDTIEIDNFMGEVIFLGLKTTRIRNYKGAIKIIANRYMDNLINYSLDNSLAIVDVSTGYEHKPEEIEKVLNELAKKLNGTIKEAKGEIEVWGINELGNSGMIYRVAVPVESMKQFTVERYLRKEIKNALVESKIKIPYPQVEVHNGKQ